MKFTNDVPRKVRVKPDKVLITMQELGWLRMSTKGIVPEIALNMAEEDLKGSKKHPDFEEKELIRKAHLHKKAIYAALSSFKLSGYNKRMITHILEFLKKNPLLQLEKLSFYTEIFPAS